MSKALSIAEAGIGAVREAEGKAGAAFRLLVEKNDEARARIAELEADNATLVAAAESHAVDAMRAQDRIAELEAERNQVVLKSHDLAEKVAEARAEVEALKIHVDAARNTAWNAALEAAELNLRAYAPHLVDGPENDVGYYHGYHTAINRIRALMKKEGEDE